MLIAGSQIVELFLVCRFLPCAMDGMITADFLRGRSVLCNDKKHIWRIYDICGAIFQLQRTSERCYFLFPISLGEWHWHIVSANFEASHFDVHTILVHFSHLFDLLVILLSIHSFDYTSVYLFN